MRKTMILLCLLFVGISWAFAQTKITGTVVSSDDGQPIIGATVLVKGTSTGTVTNIEGSFSINVPAGKVLVFSYVGMVSTELTPQNGMKVSLKSDTKQMKEVVVTALGIKRDKKSLSYSSESVSEDQISRGRDLNLASSLSGNIAGINVSSSNSGAGGSTKITLRGTKNITSTNQPLFVIDGVPLANYQTSDASGFYGGRDSGDGLSNINPDDIESMTVLKGANAAALYGSQGSNGVILITTKKGKKGTTKITFNTGVSISNAIETPKLQYSYGQTSSGSESSWGANGNYANNVSNFFNTGYTLQNSITMSGGNDKTSTYFSYANADSHGILPTNTYKKNNLTFRQSTKFLNDKLNVSSNIMVTDEVQHNTPLNGYYWNSLLGLYTFPRGLDFNYYKTNYQYLDANRNLMAQNWPVSNSEGEMNPYWILNNDPNNTHTKRIIGNVAAEYQIAKGWTVTARGTYDYTNQLYELKAAANSSSVLVSENGRYIYSNLNSWQKYADLIMTYDHTFGQDFDLHAVAGTSYQKKVIGDGVYIDSNTYGLTLANVFTIQNIASLYAFSNAQQMQSRLIKESVFANASLGYKNRIYLDLSVRNDWASSLAFTGHKSYFYPSAGLSFIVSQMVDLPKAISFAKVRTSFAQVSNEIPSFVSNPTNTVSVAGLSLNSVKPFTDLKPEIQNNYEVGLEMKFLNNRLGFDASYYQIDSKDQYLSLDAASGSGYNYLYVNAGKIRTKGYELTINATPIQTKAFTWQSSVNYSSSHNKILDLGSDLGETGQYTLSGGGEGYDMIIKKGGSLGDIYTYAYARDANGNLILDSSTHLPTKASSEQKMGNANPDFILGWNNNFSYKNFNFSFLVEGKFGGKFVSMTQAYLDALGVTQTTANARDAGGVYVSGVLADGTPWSGTVDAQTYYTGTAGRGGIMEAYVYDATNVRLRQAVLGYTINMAKYVKFISNINLSLVGSNLFFFYKNCTGDPNSTISTGNGTQSVENFSMPSTRSFTFNAKINF
jgi:TonB-linked SusC/RagA family outer membrane protein